MRCFGIKLTLLAATGLLVASSVAAESNDVGLQIDVAAALKARVAPAARPERALLLSIARAGQRLVSVGEHGTIALSDDHGASWRNAEVPLDVTLTAVKFATERTGWAIGHMGVVLRTDDGGEHWRKQLDGIAIAALAKAKAATDADSSDRSQMVRVAAEAPDKPLLDLLIEDGQRLTVIGAFNVALETVDGGQNWKLASDRFSNPEQMHLYGIARAGGTAFAVGEQGLVLKRVDERYVPLKSPYDGSLFGIAATGDRQLVIFGLRGNVFISLDGGDSWQRARLPGTGASINGALPLTHGRLLLYDQAGAVFASTDGGARFDRVPFDWGAPLTGMVEASDGSLVASSVAGIIRVPKTALALPFVDARVAGARP